MQICALSLVVKSVQAMCSFGFTTNIKNLEGENVYVGRFNITLNNGQNTILNKVDIVVDRVLSMLGIEDLFEIDSFRCGAYVKSGQHIICEKLSNTCLNLTEFLAQLIEVQNLNKLNELILMAYGEILARTLRPGECLKTNSEDICKISDNHLYGENQNFYIKELGALRDVPINLTLTPNNKSLIM